MGSPWMDLRPSAAMVRSSERLLYQVVREGGGEEKEGGRRRRSWGRIRTEKAGWTDEGRESEKKQRG